MNEIDNTELFWQMVWRVVYFIFFATNGYIGYNIIVTHKLYDFYGTKGEHLSYPLALIIGGLFLFASYFFCVKASCYNKGYLPLRLKIIGYLLFSMFAISGVAIIIYRKFPEYPVLNTYYDLSLTSAIILGGINLYISFIFCNGYYEGYDSKEDYDK